MKYSICAEYEMIFLPDAAKAKKNERLNLVIQTICGTGIRVSELQYITVESLQKGEAVVRSKGKNRRIFIVSELQKKLTRYAREQRIAFHAGSQLHRVCIQRGCNLHRNRSDRW